MSRHHIMPPAIYTPPPPKKIEKKKPRMAIGMLSELDETEEARETGETGSSTPASRPLQQNLAEIEDASSKPWHPSGRLSQATLSELLRVQELK
ncbi:hypothetical protein [Bradyrhizobium sp.]|uniref:hypothetical protein n=1 Tax=Bradyrhizobium sp. TaxID=376 RepID=UPI002D51D5BE|nr:hypothetical protein [Bradyrhizobium sp.]HZR71408.1 hypothetical protein [Bradyrhizobium sp.]